MAADAGINALSTSLVDGYAFVLLKYPSIKPVLLILNTAGCFGRNLSNAFVSSSASPSSSFSSANFVLLDDMMLKLIISLRRSSLVQNGKEQAKAMPEN